MALTNLTKPRARWATFKLKAAGAISRSIYEALLDKGISVKDFGAKGDGTTDDTVAIQTTMNFSAVVKFPDGSFHVTAPLIYNTQAQFIGANPAMTHGDRTTIKITRETWTGGSSDVAVFQRGNRDTSAQSITFKYIGFVGFADIAYNSLHEAEDIGIDAIDASGIKDGLQLIGCSFRKMSHGVRQISTNAYLGFISFNNCHWSECYRAISAKPTTGISIKDSRIYDCYDWIAGNEVYLNNVAFNNSSRASESCGITGFRVLATACWFEGGNRWINSGADYTSLRAELNSCILSEASSSSGATKFMVNNSTDVEIRLTMKKCRFPTNTRLFSKTVDPQYLDKVSLHLEGCYNIADLWAGEATKLHGMINAGMSYFGVDNSRRIGVAYEPLLNSSVNRHGSQAGNDGFGIIGTKVGIGATLNFAATNAVGHTPFSATEPHFAKFAIVGNGNGAGSTASYYTEFVVAKGYGASGWALFAIGTDGSSSADTLSLSIADVTLTNEGNDSFSVTVTPTHAGNKADTSVYCIARSAGVYSSDEV